MTGRTLNHDKIATLLAVRGGEDPVISLYVRAWGDVAERRATLKNLTREADEVIEADTGWDSERKKEARGLLEQVRQRAEALLSRPPAQGRGSHALFAHSGGNEVISLPIDLHDRLVVDRSPYVSPLSSVLDQYERYGVILCDEKRAIIFESYLGEVEGWEEVVGEHERHRRAPAGGPQRTATRTRPGNYQGLEELRRRGHAKYVLHQHLAEVADRTFRRYRVRPFDRLILAGNEQVIPQLEAHLHSYLRERVVAREPLSMNLALNLNDLRERVAVIETRVEREKEVELLDTVRDQLGSSGLGTTGLDETLRSLFFGKVSTLIVLDGEGTPGRECPDCNFLFEWANDVGKEPPTLVECPICKRSTRRVPDLIDCAVELAIVSGASVEHIAHEKDKLRELGGAAAILRFK